ncbi:fimbrial protein [Lelliottia sp. CFBP8978]|jgi:type 1 fimbria pilin|uniref:fimbrial protein n=1 Tax=Lelliottia sp. CFBP8978 TaxID=3096522 RepID=UPI002A6AF21B|nr:fimbrial protein [Lelliottia sp. CFBP8978]MDY1038403.1 fimbrial protein [Lelliottia sp. CFBP8978]
MKKNFFFFAMTAAAIGFTGMVNAGDTLGTYEMQVTGNVIPLSACVVTAPSSLSFDNISPEDISLVENGPKHDNLYLIEISGCHKDLKVSATVLGVADSINNELLSTQMVPGAAENVAVAFYEQVGNAHPVVAINTGHTSSSTINEFGTAQIIMQADVVLADYTKRATPGTIAANANVQINFL